MKQEIYMKSEWVLPEGFYLRLADSNDEEFLQQLFCSARPELAQLPLPPAQLTQLMRQQYESQQHSYRKQYPQLEHWIITTSSGCVGKIMFERSPSAVHIIDFIVAPEWRGRGLGRAILTRLKEHADSSMSLQVDRQNINAKRFYHQLGFVTSQSSDTHNFLIWS